MLEYSHSTTEVANVSFIDDFEGISVKVGLTYVEAPAHIVDVNYNVQWTQDTPLYNTIGCWWRCRCCRVTLICLVSVRAKRINSLQKRVINSN